MCMFYRLMFAMFNFPEESGPNEDDRDPGDENDRNKDDDDYDGALFV